MIRLKAGDPAMTITPANGAASEIITMEAPPVNKDGRIYIPVRYVAEALGLTVGWDMKTQTVLLTK
jgi:hypothetical protein